MKNRFTVSTSVFGTLFFGLEFALENSAFYKKKVNQSFVNKSK
jgi:preprotein translocase subunit SecG